MFAHCSNEMVRAFDLANDCPETCYAAILWDCDHQAILSQ